MLFLNAAAGGVSNLLKVGLQLALLPIMARLLGPSEYGLYAMAMPIVAFFTVLADGGIGSSLARERESSAIVWSTAFWLLLGSCTLLAFCVTLVGFIFSTLSDQPRLTSLIAVLSVSFILIALSALPAARMVRRGNLLLHSFGDVLSALIGGIVAVVFAFNGAGAWSLAAQYISGFVIRAIIFNLAAFEAPTLELDFKSLLPHVAVGGSVVGSRLIEFLGRLLENLIYGHFFGAGALGTFALANQVSRFLCEAVSNPLWGALYAHALHEDVQKVSFVYNSMFRVMCIVLSPAVVLLIFSAPQIFALILGDKWIASIYSVQVLLPFYAITSIVGIFGSILLANGLGGVLFWTLTTLSGGRVLAVSLGPVLGPEAVIWGIGIANVFYSVLVLAIAAKLEYVKIRAVLSNSFWPITASILSGLVYNFCVAQYSVSPINVLLYMIVYLISYLILLSLIEGKKIHRDLTRVFKMFNK
jgi:PST family polysaccharide transporter